MNGEAITNERFNLQFSMCLEEIIEIFNRRINNLLLFLQLLLGSAAMVGTGSALLNGFIIAAISALQLTFRFGEKSSTAHSQKLAYERLCFFHDAGKEVCASEYIKDDSSASGSFKMIAQQCAIIALGEDDKINLNLWHKFIAIFVGQTQVLTY